MPFAPGTFGSLVSLLPAYFAVYYGGVLALSAYFIITTVIGWILVPWFEQTYGPDPKSFVLDEWAGQALPFYLIIIFSEKTDDYILLFIIAAFVIFRVYDILKPFGIRQIEQLGGAKGVMLDDLVAGVYTFITLFFLILAVL